MRGSMNIKFDVRTIPENCFFYKMYLATGGSMMQAFDRLEVAELSAKSLMIGAL